MTDETAKNLSAFIDSLTEMLTFPTDEEYMDEIKAHVKSYLTENKVLISYIKKPARTEVKLTYEYEKDENGVIVKYKGKPIIKSVNAKPINRGPQIVGVVVATGANDIGWSRRMKSDKYCKDTGRWEAFSKIGVPPCNSMRVHYDKMVARAAKYFRDDYVPSEKGEA